MSRQSGSEGSVFGLLIVSLCLFGCGEILGIETLESSATEDPATQESGESRAGTKDGPDGAGAMDAEGGDDRPGAEPERGGAGAMNRPDAEAGSDDRGSGGAAGDATEPAGKPGSEMGAGAEADAGVDLPPSGPVSGTIIDMWGHPVPDALVTVGEETIASKADGTFSFAEVGPVYDVELYISARSYGSTVVNGWIFEGLTRRDPTLEVYRGRTEMGSTLNIEVTNVTVDESNSIPDDQSLVVAFGSPDGAFDLEMGGLKVSYLSGAWFGPEATAGTTHGLLWEHNDDIPVRYLAYDSVPTAMNVNQDGQVTLDLSEDELTVDAISGTLGATEVGDREVAIYARFNSNAVLPLVNDSRVTDVFSYPVPSLPDAALTVVGNAGHGFWGEPVTTTYLDNVVPGKSGLQLDFRRPPTLISPPPGTTGAAEDQEFKWRKESPVSVVRISLSGYYETLFIVTAKSSTRLRTLSGSGFQIRPGEQAAWEVEHHGDYASVDEATGKDGFLSPLAFGEPDGRRRVSGFYTQSATNGIVVGTGQAASEDR